MNSKILEHRKDFKHQDLIILIEETGVISHLDSKSKIKILILQTIAIKDL
jgi:hypothetical protein